MLIKTFPNKNKHSAQNNNHRLRAITETNLLKHTLLAVLPWSSLMASSRVRETSTLKYYLLVLYYFVKPGNSRNLLFEITSEFRRFFHDTFYPMTIFSVSHLWHHIGQSFHGADDIWLLSLFILMWKLFFFLESLVCCPQTTKHLKSNLQGNSTTERCRIVFPQQPATYFIDTAYAIKAKAAGDVNVMDEFSEKRGNHSCSQPFSLE